MRLMIYPSSKEISAFARYGEFLKDYNEIVFVAPKGWGHNGEDFSVLDGGEVTGKKITADFEKELEYADAVFFSEAAILLPPKFLAGRIKMALDSGKKVFADKVPDLLNGQPEIEKVIMLQGESFRYKKGVEDKPPGVCLIPAPVIFVMGLGPNTNKFEVQLALRRYLQNAGYSVSQTGPKKASYFWGFESFPECILDDQLSIRDKIVALNRYIYEKCLREKPDVMIIGIPGSLIPLNPMKYEEIGEMAFMMFQAVRPDAVVLNVYAHQFTQEYFDELKILCQYKFNFELKYVAVSNTNVSLSPESHECEYVTVPLSVVQQNYIAEDYNDVQLFCALDKQDMERLGEAVIDGLINNM